MTPDEVAELERKRDETLVKLQEVRIAKKTLCFLYPEAGGRGKPKCARVVLRRFFQREIDMFSFLEFYENELQTETKKGDQK